MYDEGLCRALGNLAPQLVRHCLEGVPSATQAALLASLAEHLPSCRELLADLVPSCLARAGVTAGSPCLHLKSGEKVS